MELPGGPLHLAAAKVSLHAEPADGGGLRGKGSVSLTGLKLASGKTSVTGDDLALDFDGIQAADGGVTGRVGVRFRRLEVEGGPPVVAGEGQVELRVDQVYPAADDPLKTRGDAALSVGVGSLDVRSPGMRVVAAGLSLHAHTHLSGARPYALELDAPVTRLRLLGRDGALLVDGPVQLRAALRDVTPDLAHPDATRGSANVSAALGETKVSLEATKINDAVDFVLHADAPSLKVVRPFLPPALAKDAPWDAIGVTVRSSGRAEHIRGGAPYLQQTTVLEIQRPAFETVSAHALTLTLHSKGDALQHDADADLRLQGLAFGGEEPRDDHVTLSATLDRTHPSFRFQIATDGRAVTKVTASASFDPGRRAVPYAIEAHLAGLAPLGPFLAKVRGLEGFDLGQLELGLSATGALLGTVAAIGSDGAFRLEPNPSRTAAVEGERAELRVAHLHWSHADDAVIAPTVSWHGEMRAAGGRRTIDSHLEVAALHLDLGPKDVDVAQIRDDSSVTVSGDLQDPETAITQHASSSEA